MSAPVRVRSVFISDLHLGYKGADIRALNSFLSAHDFEHLYLVGDILDGWKLEQRWYWPDDYSEFLDIVVDRIARGVRVVLLTGNHDERLRVRDVVGLRPAIFARFGLDIRERMIHKLADGRQIIVMHGDQFDSRLMRGVSKHADSLWSRLGHFGWERPASEPAEGYASRIRWSLGKEIATSAKSLIWSFADTALREAARHGMDGIICGHSHVPNLIARDDYIFANCGSWTGAREAISGHTAIVESVDGRLDLVKWPSNRRVPKIDQSNADCLSGLRTRTFDAAALAKLAFRLWAPAGPHHAPPLPSGVVQNSRVFTAPR